ncbi:hypothetical protein M378DRAFT_171541 [Amanita muscaria Koide BX008]|uniref:Uncharacterized protein n=1 Tax=Amanita muscaria (strain Koide BX008) TaxID=946122 RepID=A0A0C2WLQ9_AMAMK|nr:hypothetical protein M378DRAFT_171541 [Amanita muscaria Koide BX008]
MSPSRTSPHLDEQVIQDGFHSYLRSSLAQAKAERLLDPEILSSAQADLMVTGPALCLYFAALRCTTNPPSVPLPRTTTTTSSKSSSPPIDLSFDNCPPVFAHFLRVWAESVPKIQFLIPEHQHDLARVICGLEPISQPLNIAINGIAADLRAVAIEISQRRSFQDRYASDLQAALDAGESLHKRTRKVSFVPPPMYEDATIPISPRPSPTPSPSHSPRPSIDSGLRPAPSNKNKNLPSIPIPSPGLLSPHSTSQHSPQRRRRGGKPHRPQTPQSPRSPTSPASPSSPTSPSSPSSPTRSFPQRSAQPTILAPSSPAIEFIRETLYASVGDALERLPSLRLLLKRDPPRAYFASVAFAILDIATTSITPDNLGIIGVLGTPLRLADCPLELRPFMKEIINIGVKAKEIEERDNNSAMECASRGEELPDPVMDRVKVILELGVGHEREGGRGGRTSFEGRAVTFANRINALSLAMTKLRAFRERQEQVFKILAGIGSS